MNDKARERYKRRLEKEKERLDLELKRIRSENAEAAATASVEASGDGNYEDHMGDAASTVFEWERDLSLEQNIEDMLAQVGIALEKIDTPAFGVCSRCRRKITADRLQALPWAELCITCKRTQEEEKWS